MHPRLFVRALGLLLLAIPAPLLAQDAAPPADTPPPITIVLVEGRVDTVRASGVQPAQAPDLLEEDDRLVTADGRAELAYADGSRVHLDRGTDVRVDLGVRLRLVRGRIVVHTPRDSDPLEVATPAGLVRMEPDGEYDLAAADLDGDTVIAAVRGRAALADGDSELPIAADDELRIDPRDRRPRWARVLPPDVFRHWAASRVATTTRAARDYGLPSSLAPYASEFADHGQWTSMAPYGQVWIPSAPFGWRPYAHGSWRHTRYGWTWIDSDRWAWPVHHFGRWGHHNHRGWFWIPQRTWGPAWVGWAMAADHVAWSPLGWDARPVVDFFAGARIGPVDVWANSWSILPRRSFGGRGSVYRYLEDPRRLPGPVLGGFVSQMVGPRGPAGPDDRFSARPGRRSWGGPGGGSSPGGPGERERRVTPRSPGPEPSGSTAPSRNVGGTPDRGDRDDRGDVRRRDVPPPSVTVAPPRASGAPAQRRGRDDVQRRPGDARPVDASSPPDVYAEPAYRDRPDGESRRPNSIRPRYEPPASTPPAAAAPSPAPVAAPPPQRGPSDGGRERARPGSGIERRDGPRGGRSDGARSGDGGAVNRAGGGRESGAAPASRPAQRGETASNGTSGGARRRPR